MIMTHRIDEKKGTLILELTWDEEVYSREEGYYCVPHETSTEIKLQDLVEAYWKSTHTEGDVRGNV